VRTAWDRTDHTGQPAARCDAVMRGRCSKRSGAARPVHGEFAPEFRAQIPGPPTSALWASGISLIAYEQSERAGVHRTPASSSPPSLVRRRADLTPVLDAADPEDADTVVFMRPCRPPAYAHQRDDILII